MLRDGQEHEIRCIEGVDAFKAVLVRGHTCEERCS